MTALSIWDLLASFLYSDRKYGCVIWCFSMLLLLETGHSIPAPVTDDVRNHLCIIPVGLKFLARLSLPPLCPHHSVRDASDIHFS